MRWLSLALLLVSLPAAAAPTLTISPPTVAPGSPITVSVRGAGGSASDWVWAPGATPEWAYLTGSKDWPGSTTPIVSADLTFMASATPGFYAVTFYANNDTKITLAGPVAYTVAAGAPVPPPPAGSGVTSLNCKDAASCTPTTGNVVLTVPKQPGPPGPVGLTGPTGPQGNMARGTPVKGSTCADGDSFYNYDSPTAPKLRYTWTCGADLKWHQDKFAVSVVPW